MRLTESFLAGDVSPTTYQSAGRKMRGELNRLDAELGQLRQAPTDVMTRVDEMLARATSIWDLHDGLHEAGRSSYCGPYSRPSSSMTRESSVLPCDLRLMPSSESGHAVASHNISDDGRARRIAGQIVKHVTNPTASHGMESCCLNPNRSVASGPLNRKAEALGPF